MKTNAEISEWLEKQPWIDKFKRNILEDGSRSFLDDIMAGELRENTFDTTFTWAFSPEGFKFWCKINDEFLKWIGYEEH